MTVIAPHFKPNLKLKRLYTIRLALAFGAMVIVPQLIILLEREGVFSFPIVLMLIIVIAIVGFMILPKQDVHLPVEDIRLRQFNPAVEWHQLFVWLKQNQNRQDWGEPRVALNNILQVAEGRQERIIQIKRKQEWVHAGFVIWQESDFNRRQFLIGDQAIDAEDIKAYIQQLIDVEQSELE